MTDLNRSLAQQFEQHFSASATGHTSAPGRVNLIGEHTDYNNGFVFPCAIDKRTHVVFKPRQDSQINIVSANYANAVDSFDAAQLIVAGDHAWANYVRGVAAELKQDGMAVPGMDMLIYGDVPQGAGLSSSAALEIAVGAAITIAAKAQINPTYLAQIGQRAENQFLNCQCGIMDQLISATAQANSATLIDCQDLSLRPVRLPDNLAIVIVHSGIKRELVGSEYNVRRETCESAAKKLGTSSLRELGMDTLLNNRSVLTDIEFKRAHHVLSENDRTLKSAAALQANDLDSMYKYMRASHISMRDDYEITIPEIDWLFEQLNTALGDKGAARMTGGGFGGALVALCEKEQAEPLIQTIRYACEQVRDINPNFYLCQAEQGLKTDEI